jgi:AraC-like DNA-binding protein
MSRPVVTSGPRAASSTEGFDFATCDPDRAHAFLRQAYVENTMRITGSLDGFHMRHVHQQTERFSIGTLSHTMSVEHRAQPLGYLLVGRVLHGRFERETDGETLRSGEGDVFVIASPDKPYIARWEAVDLQLTRVDPVALAQVGGAAGAGTPQLTGLQPISPGSARHLIATLDWLTDELLPNPDATASPLIVGSAARTLAAAVLNTFPYDAPEAVPADRTDATPAALRRAIEFIEAHAHTDIALADVAAAAAVTPRAVHYAFQRHLGTSPIDHLRTVRLDRAHHDLLAADPTRGDTVNAVATRWGFHHPGRFATAYRLAFGVTPGHTLRS